VQSANLHQRDKQGQERVEFLRKILHRSLAHIQEQNPDMLESNIEQWPLFDLEALLSQLWVPQSQSHRTIIATLLEMASPEEPLEALQVCVLLRAVYPRRRPS
jgi:hypothetical protein